MADETLLTWNVTNWVTVILMVTLGFFILGALTKIYQQKRGKAS